MEYIYIIGSVQALFFALFIITKQKKYLSDKILLIWLLVYSFNMIIPFLAYHTNEEISDTFLGIDLMLITLHPILMYLFTRTFSIKPIKKTVYLNIIPFIISVSLFRPFYLMPLTEKEEVVLNFGKLPPNITAMLSIAVTCNILYLILSLKVLKSFKRRLKLISSYNENLTLKWLQIVIFGDIAFFILSIILTSVLTSVNYTIPEVDQILYVFVTIYIFIIAFTGIKYGTMHQSEIQQIKSYKVQDVKKEEIKKTRKEETISKLKAVMKDEKPYLNNKLTIYELAAKVHIPSYFLSQIFNKDLNSNFYDFVNLYRVEEVKKQIKENPNFSFLAIALDCGFNSKASFNRIFKKQTKITPSEYLKKHVSKN